MSLVLFCALNYFGGVSFFFLLDFFHLHCKYLITFNTKAVEMELGVLCIGLGLLAVRLLNRIGGEQAVMLGSLY